MSRGDAMSRGEGAVLMRRNPIGGGGRAGCRRDTGKRLLAGRVRGRIPTVSLGNAMSRGELTALDPLVASLLGGGRAGRCRDAGKWLLAGRKGRIPAVSPGVQVPRGEGVISMLPNLKGDPCAGFCPDARAGFCRHTRTSFSSHADAGLSPDARAGFRRPCAGFCLDAGKRSWAMCRFRS